ncbi:YtxH domain-containing protein [Salsuginibacillus kocurii]|uniref:YtxH domain-containing protein n=1 Tax=Salsuginibacillus kocurii TaxID=427078 RepID=UPI00035E1AE6|nr:YtxH domain-containing protein [Salsuginibacillus kocurii]
MKNHSFFFTSLGFLAGGVLTSAITLLVAPVKGETLRQKGKETVQQVRNVPQEAKAWKASKQQQYVERGQKEYDTLHSLTSTIKHRARITAVQSTVNSSTPLQTPKAKE